MLKTRRDVPWRVEQTSGFKRNVSFVYRERRLGRLIVKVRQLKIPELHAYVSSLCSNSSSEAQSPMQSWSRKI